MAYKRYLALIGVVLFIFIMLQQDLEEIVRILSGANPWLFLFVGFLSLLTGAIKGYRWSLIMKSAGIEVPVLQAIKFFYIGFFISLFTPGRVGEAARALYVRPWSKSVSKALPTIMVDRLMDIVLLVILSIVAVFGLASVFGILVMDPVLLAAIAIGFSIALAFFFRKGAVAFVLRPFFSMFVPEKMKDKLQVSFHNFYDALKKSLSSRKLLAVSFLLTCVSWTISIILGWLLLLAINVDTVPLYYMAFVMPILSLLDMLPVSVSGVGVREAGAIPLLGLMAVTSEQAVSFSLLVLVAGYLFTFALGGLLMAREKINPLDEFKEILK